MWRLIFMQIAAMLLMVTAYAQEPVSWPSPEVEQMYKQARDYLSKGAVKQSIVLLQQAIQLAPEVVVLHRDLGQALNLAQNYDEAYNTVEPIIKNDQADELTYQVAGAALFGKGDQKKARRTIEGGIKAYPQSGILHHELARYYEANNDLEYALDALLKGIQVDPFYHLNYYDAARLYLNTSRPVWTVIYGEIFANLERHTNRSLETRKMMLQAYQKIFSTVGTTSVPKYGSAVTEGEEQSFEAAVLQVFMQLAPVVSDGITTENLIMLRTRFIMDWNSNFANRFPFTLFTYHDRMLRDGEFDAYNQWLFGMAENEKQYDSWTKFHTEAIPEFEKWLRSNQYKPTAADFYNSKDVRNLFSNKKKKA